MKRSSVLWGIGSVAVLATQLTGCGVGADQTSSLKNEVEPKSVDYREIGLESFKFELNDLAVDANSFWVNSLFQTDNLGTDECFIELAKDTRLNATSEKISVSGTWNFLPCLSKMEEGGQKNEWEIAEVQFGLEVSCEGLDHSSYHQVLLFDGVKILREQCKDAPSVSLKQSMTSRTKGIITVNYSGTEFVNAMDFQSTSSFGALDGQPCRTTRVNADQYQIDGCRNAESEVDISQLTYKMANGEVKVEPTKTQMEITQQDYSNIIAQPFREGSAGEEELKGQPVSGRIDFIRNNWTGSISFVEGSKPAYHANGIIAGENKVLEGIIE